MTAIAIVLAPAPAMYLDIHGLAPPPPVTFTVTSPDTAALSSIHDDGRRPRLDWTSCLRVRHSCRCRARSI